MLAHGLTFKEKLNFKNTDSRKNAKHQAAQFQNYDATLKEHKLNVMFMTIPGIISIMRGYVVYLKP